MDPLGYGLPSIFFCQRTSFVPFFRCTGHSLQLLSDELGPLWWWLAPSHDGTHTPKKNLEREWSPGVVWEFSTAVFGIIHKHSHPEKRKRRDQKKTTHAMRRAGERLFGISFSWSMDERFVDHVKFVEAFLIWGSLGIKEDCLASPAMFAHETDMRKDTQWTRHFREKIQTRICLRYMHLKLLVKVMVSKCFKWFLFSPPYLTKWSKFD